GRVEDQRVARRRLRSGGVDLAQQQLIEQLGVQRRLGFAGGLRFAFGRQLGARGLGQCHQEQRAGCKKESLHPNHNNPAPPLLSAMPELPEVEVTRLSLADRIAGARIESVRVGKPLRWPLGLQAQRLVGRTVKGVRRRGKYLLFDLDEGLLLLHLGMSGSLTFAAEAPPAAKLLGRLGVEPLSDAFVLEGFHAGLKQRHAAVKQVLLAGDLVVGVGNIYASEALFLAGIRPTLRASRISRPRAEKLRAAVRDVLARAVAAGGSTLRDFSNSQGESGYFQLQAMVYDRAGEPCRICGTPVKCIRQGQRASYFCPNCQKS